GKKRGDVVEVDHTEAVGEGESAYEDRFHYKITIHEVKKRVLAPLDDEFAKDVSEEFRTLEDLKAKVRKDLDYAEEQRRRGEILEDIYKQLTERVVFDLPVSMVRSMANRSIGQTEQRLREYGMTLRSLNADILNNYVERAHADATVEVRRFLLADQVGRFLDVQVTDEKLDAEIEKIAERQNRKPLAVRASLEAQKKIEDFRADLRIHAVNDRLIEMAEVRVVEKKESALPTEAGTSQSETG
ncbi:hypothetical protein HZA57_03815, partial [Candidatus Poribacteria bacterium]|nr:hypothetical protein [Candidatus Poribacteria bacterium]